MAENEAHQEGRRLVAAAREQWVRQLIDNSRNNTLLFYRELKVGTLDLTDWRPAVDDLLRWKAVGQEALLPPGDNAPAMRGHARSEKGSDAERQRLLHRLTAIQRKAREDEEEKGLETLVLALGSASWPAGDGGRAYDAPVLLVPVRIRSRGRTGEDLRLEPCGEPKGIGPDAPSWTGRVTMRFRRHECRTRFVPTMPRVVMVEQGQYGAQGEAVLQGCSGTSEGDSASAICKRLQ